MDRTAKEDTGVKQQILRRIYLFSGFPSRIWRFWPAWRSGKPSPGKPLSFRKGKRLRGFFCSSPVRVKLVKSSLEGKEYIIRLVGPGESFAEAAVFGEIPYPATAIALEDCHTIYFPKGPFLQHLAASRHWPATCWPP